MNLAASARLFDPKEVERLKRNLGDITIPDKHIHIAKVVLVVKSFSGIEFNRSDIFDIVTDYCNGVYMPNYMYTRILSSPEDVEFMNNVISLSGKIEYKEQTNMKDLGPFDYVRVNDIYSEDESEDTVISTVAYITKYQFLRYLSGYIWDKLNCM